MRTYDSTYGDSPEILDSTSSGVFLAPPSPLRSRVKSNVAEMRDRNCNHTISPSLSQNQLIGAVERSSNVSWNQPTTSLRNENPDSPHFKYNSNQETNIPGDITEHSFRLHHLHPQFLTPHQIDSGKARTCTILCIKPIWGKANLEDDMHVTY